MTKKATPAGLKLTLIIDGRRRKLRDHSFLYEFTISARELTEVSPGESNLRNLPLPKSMVRTLAREFLPLRDNARPAIVKKLNAIGMPTKGDANTVWQLIIREMPSES